MRNTGDKFDKGMATITRTLFNIEIEHGTREAKATARATIDEYVRAVDKSLFDYGVICGTIDWLAAAAGIITLKGVSIVKYQGIVKDRLGECEDRKTKHYTTYQEAHIAAERLCEKHFSDERGEIDVITIPEN